MDLNDYCKFCKLAEENLEATEEAATLGSYEKFKYLFGERKKLYEEMERIYRMSYLIETKKVGKTHPISIIHQIILESETLEESLLYYRSIKV